MKQYSRLNFPKRMKTSGRRINTYWAIRIASKGRPMIGYGVEFSRNKYKKDGFKFFYLGRQGAYFRLRRSSPKLK